MSDRTTGSQVAAGALDDHPAVNRVRAALREAGLDQQVVVLTEHVRTAAAAAEQLGVRVGQIANSLVFAIPDPDAPEGRRALLVLTSGAHRVDTAKLARTLGVPALERADPDFVRRTTGFAIGGVAPAGHLTAVRTVVDTALAGYPEVWAAAGHPRTVFRTSFDELVRLTGGLAAEVA